MQFARNCASLAAGQLCVLSCWAAVCPWLCASLAPRKLCTLGCGCSGASLAAGAAVQLGLPAGVGGGAVVQPWLLGLEQGLFAGGSCKPWLGIILVETFDINPRIH